MKVYEGINGIEYGESLEIQATDPSFENDIKVWCEKTGNQLLELEKKNNIIYVKIKKFKKSMQLKQRGNGKTMVVFSNDLDKTIASFIIANGAASMGREVTMFFTFWGLNILRKSNYVKVKKDFISRMFGMMMPRGSKKLTLSKMNMGGIGGKMIRGLMKSKNISSLEELIDSAQKAGVKFVACTMSMDIMGIKREELIDNVDIGGVATFLGASEDADMSLFI
jgi:peroxiredoxin family protein/TusA-related sulfurtransferase